MSDESLSLLFQAGELRRRASEALPALDRLSRHPDPEIAAAAIELGRVCRALAGHALLEEVLVPQPAWWRRVLSRLC